MLTHPSHTLVIGYGNTLRSDDGVGYRVAAQVADWALPSVASLAVHQLTPDLAEAIAHTSLAIFVDAIALDPAATPEVQIQQLHPNHTPHFTNHYADPRSLLTLAHLLYDSVPTAYHILIPALEFAVSETLSEVTQESMAIALHTIQQFIGSGPSPEETCHAPPDRAVHGY